MSVDHVVFIGVMSVMILLFNRCLWIMLFLYVRERENSYISVSVREKNFVRSMFTTRINCFMVPRDMGEENWSGRKNWRQKCMKEGGDILHDMRHAVFMLHVYLGVLVSLFVYSFVSFSCLLISKSHVRF